MLKEIVFIIIWTFLAKMYTQEAISQANTYVDDMYNLKESKRNKRLSEANASVGHYKVSEKSLYIELLIVIDNELNKSFNADFKKVHQHSRELANYVNALFSSLDIVVSLAGVVVWDKRDEIEIVANSSVTLRNFSAYRKKVLLPLYSHDHAQLLTARSFDMRIKGLSYVNRICSESRSCSLIVDNINNVPKVGGIMAHELGHSLGLSHDKPECTCKHQKCVMSHAGSAIPQDSWTNCNIDELKTTLSKDSVSCLYNKPKSF